MILMILMILKRVWFHHSYQIRIKHTPNVYQTRITYWSKTHQICIRHGSNKSIDQFTSYTININQHNKWLINLKFNTTVTQYNVYLLKSINKKYFMKLHSQVCLMCMMHHTENYKNGNTKTTKHANTNMYRAIADQFTNSFARALPKTKKKYFFLQTHALKHTHCHHTKSARKNVFETRF